MTPALIADAADAISARLCPADGHAGPGAFHPEPVPMYSYSRPAADLWRGFAAGLLARGFTPAQVTAELQSKGTRWLLDEHAGRVEALGRALAADYAPCVTNL